MVMLMVMVGVVKVNINREKVQRRSFFFYYFVPQQQRKKNVKKESEKRIYRGTRKKGNFASRSVECRKE